MHVEREGTPLQKDRIQKGLDRASSTIAHLKAQAAILALEMAVKDYEQKRGYDPNQPRWPAGETIGNQPIGGRWRDTDAQIAEHGTFDESRRPLCDDQWTIDLDVCRASGSPQCYDMMMERWDNCMRDVFVPPLRHSFPRRRK